MKKILNYIILSVFIATAYSCEEDTPDRPNYLTFATSSQTTTVDVGAGSGSVDVVVYTGNTTGSDRTFSLMVDTVASTADAAAYTVPASVTVPGGTNEGSFTVQFNESGLDFEFSSVVVMFTPTTDIFTTSDTNSVTINAGLVCPTANEVTIDVTTDNWPDETSWELTDGSGAVVASGGPYNNPADDFTTITTNLTLPAGTYSMTLFDAYGDGGSTFVIMNGCAQEYASGATPDAGGGYPVVTSVIGSFTLD